MYVYIYIWYICITSTATYCHNRKRSNWCGFLKSPHKAITSITFMSPPRLPKDLFEPASIATTTSILPAQPASERMRPCPSLASLASRSRRPEGKTPSTANSEWAEQTERSSKDENLLHTLPRFNIFQHRQPWIDTISIVPVQILEATLEELLRWHQPRTSWESLTKFKY